MKECGCTFRLKDTPDYFGNIPVYGAEILFCPIHDAAEKMLLLLKKLEFSQESGLDGDYCPSCGQYKHEKDCELAAVIASAEGRCLAPNTSS
jgi:hypothetical protein